jgi:hypothetical protein
MRRVRLVGAQASVLVRTEQMAREEAIGRT